MYKKNLGMCGGMCVGTLFGNLLKRKIKKAVATHKMVATTFGKPTA